MNKFTAPLVLALSVLSGNASADCLGLYVGGGGWDHDAVGTYGASSTINIETELD